MYTNTVEAFDIAKGNYKALVEYCKILEGEGYFVQAEKIICKSILETLDFYIQSLLIKLAVCGEINEEEVNFIVSLLNTNQYNITSLEDVNNDVLKKVETVIKAPPIILQLFSLRDKEKNSKMSLDYIDMILNIIVAMSYLDLKRDEFLPKFIVNYYDSIEAFIFLADKAEIDERYLLRKASGDINQPYSRKTRLSSASTKNSIKLEKSVSNKNNDVANKDVYKDIDKDIDKISDKILKSNSENAVLAEQNRSEPIKEQANNAKTTKCRLDELIKELEGLVGLEDVKTEVHSLINLINVRKLRKEKGLPSPDISYHMVFTGSPGTGKTTVARLIASIYKELGILKKGTLIEVDRSGLVAGYVGQTALKVTDVVNKALGGVLFIDEAYSLSGGVNDFGIEAIDTLVKLMEDHRDDLVVIVAGYTDEMKVFLNSNTGLVSRFNKFIEFKDYSEEELISILISMADKIKMKLTEEALEKLKNLLSNLDEKERISFGNARGIRNLFEKMLVGQANRLSELTEPTVDDLSIITKDDF